MSFLGSFHPAVGFDDAADSDCDGTSDDLPPSHQNRGVTGGNVTGNGKLTVNRIHCAKMKTDMEIQIHQLQIEAYSSILRAFKADSDVITWEQENLITELRNELRVSLEEHREILRRVNADSVLQKMRFVNEDLQSQGLKSGLKLMYGPEPTSTFNKRKRMSQPSPFLSVDPSSPEYESQPVATPAQPCSESAKRAAITGSNLKKLKSVSYLEAEHDSSMKSTQIPPAGSTGKGHVPNKKSYGTRPLFKAVKQAPCDSLIGQKFKIRWPEDNKFYEALITDYNQVKDEHLIVYDKDTKNETFEWVNFKLISPKDIRWEVEDPGIIHRSAEGAPACRITKSTSHDDAVPHMKWRKGPIKKQPKKDFTPSRNDILNKRIHTIEILHTSSLVNEEHEQSLIDAINMLADVTSDGESDD
ncbi:protein EMSY-LIKE 3 isoform X2 [Canna indica]|uniref:Protein EMSY-LIKE 3 isoform X2 n=1 Tax=Canna indica TaxID=4628 RepID=A0AAQ3JXP5_9LILI|nr:protein EMSY-LIKE 3 isoform X2 [Canna indica]